MSSYRPAKQVVLNAPKDRAAALQFVSVISHDMREPMNAIVGMTRLLQQSGLNPEQRMFVETIDDAANVALTLINDLLDLGRAASGSLDLAAVPFDLCDLARRCLRLAEQRTCGGPVELELNLDPELPARVLGDPARLRQVLLNLLGNAVKFTDHGRIDLQLALADAERVRFTVVDTGMGIAASDLALMLDPYEQAASSRRGNTGSGLGLAIVRALVTAMGGALDIHSKPGAGTTISFTLPMPPAAETSDQFEPATPKAVDELTVLLVEPHAATCQRLVEILTGWGVLVECCSEIEAARRILNSRRVRGDGPDAVLVAHRGSAETIEAFGHWVRDNLERLPRLLVLVDGGLRGDADRLRRAGFDAYLPGSPPPALLRRALEALFVSGEQQMVTSHTLIEDSGRSLHVLVVDDNPVNVRLARLLLERAGHQVKAASSGLEAMACLKDEPVPPDVILMDIQMPGMDGFATTKAIRASGDAYAAVPVVALTARADPEAMDEWRDAGMNGWLTKPIDTHDLLRTVDRAARARLPA